MKNKFILLSITPFLLLGCRNSGEHVTDSLGPSHYESYRVGEILKSELIENGLPYGEFETIKTDKKVVIREIIISIISLHPTTKTD